LEISLKRQLACQSLSIPKVKNFSMLQSVASVKSIFEHAFEHDGHIKIRK